MLNNDVKKIAIDDKSGEVFFSTSQGICSYRSTATESGSTNSNVMVFPNPVPPGYTGSIAIKGLVNNAVVKITELDGRMVYQTRSNGRTGQYGMALIIVEGKYQQAFTWCL